MRDMGYSKMYSVWEEEITSLDADESLDHSLSSQSGILHSFLPTILG